MDLFVVDDATCPCRSHSARFLQQQPATGTNTTTFSSTDDDDSNDAPVWEIIYTVLVLLGMFAALVMDRWGSDSIMVVALLCFLAADIVNVSEALNGFSNAGLWTVMVLFVVAEGISKTGALDWYMGKLLGQPQTIVSAQLRLMIPIAIVSAFLNNTPVVAVMIPIVQRWAKNNHLSAQQLLIPLSFASILGGTCTLIGTSTNLVVVGLLDDFVQVNNLDSNTIRIGLFDLGEYGVPVAMAGMIYILSCTNKLLPNRSAGTTNSLNDDVLLGCRLTPWSPAAGRTVQRSGLRDTGGIYLVSVHRAATGNVHRAVSKDFVLNVGDILYFTGLVESFGEFCAEHGLEVVTNELEELEQESQPETVHNTAAPPPDTLESATMHERPNTVSQLLSGSTGELPTVKEDDEMTGLDIPAEVGVTKESLMLADDAQRMRSINQLTDVIRGEAILPKSTPAAKIVVTIEKDLVVVGINAGDRPGLLLDISKGLLRFRLQLHHTEAAVVHDRSVSIWRCEPRGTDLPDSEEIWSVLNALLSEDFGMEAIKRRGLRVIRAKVIKGSSLVGKTATEVDFRRHYQAAIVAVQQVNKHSTPLSQIRFEVGDVLIVQASDDSPLLKQPPEDFYTNLNEVTKETGTLSRNSSVGSFVRMITGRKQGGSDASVGSRAKRGESENVALGARSSGEDDDFYIGFDEEVDIDEEAQILNLPEALQDAAAAEMGDTIWRDLQVEFGKQDDPTGGGVREFLTAMAVAHQSQLIGKSAMQAGIHKLPDLFLVSIERPVPRPEDNQTNLQTRQILAGVNDESSNDESSFTGSIKTDKNLFNAIDQNEPLKEGDILWFSGPAFAVGDLRKIPGLVSYENDEVKKIRGKVFDRRLVQAVVARKGPLVGKTVKRVQFRTRYGAAVIAVHREGKRVHEHPGNVKLQGGDVLLLEAGPSFIAKSAENDKSFALLAEVKDSAPPRLRLLVPALVITAAMLIVFMAGVTSLLVSALVASVLMVALGILSEQEARDALNWEIYVTIASAFGIGKALVNSGVAEAIANFLVDVGTKISLGDAGLLGAVYFATFLISNVVTNNAAAALLFPIAMDAAQQTGTDLVLMSYALMLGASASFMTPFGYTTNLLIYGPGGYKYNDFLKFGTPMQLVLLVLSTVYLAVIKAWWISWVGTATAFVAVVAFRMGVSFCPKKESKPGPAGGPETVGPS